MAKLRSFTVGEMIETSPVQLGNVGEALRAALAKNQEKEREQAEYHLHELACNIAEDLDGGHIFSWRLDEVKECIRAGGTTAIDEHGDLFLVNKYGDRWGTKYLSAGYEPTDGLKARPKGLGMPSVVDDPHAHLCPGCAAAERDGIKTTCGGQC